jgi:hypothetical protein
MEILNILIYLTIRRGLFFFQSFAMDKPETDTGNHNDHHPAPKRLSFYYKSDCVLARS